MVDDIDGISTSGLAQAYTRARVDLMSSLGDLIALRHCGRSYSKNSIQRSCD